MDIDLDAIKADWIQRPIGKGVKIYVEQFESHGKNYWMYIGIREAEEPPKCGDCGTPLTGFTSGEGETPEYFCMNKECEELQRKVSALRDKVKKELEESKG